jgi:MurNAc alpha-1-phosphate uridylyltransferase
MNHPMIADTAFVFAAGFGKRMLPLTLEVPKPMAKVAGKMMIEYALDNLERAGIHNVVVNTYHLAEVINPWLEERAKLLKPRILISHEKTVLLDTAGGIVQALPLLGIKPFFTINGDIIWYDNPQKASVFAQICQHWNPDTMDILMLLCPKEKAIGYEGKGDFGLNEGGFITRSEEGNPYVYCGIQLIKPSLFEGLPIKPFSLREIYMARKHQDGSYQRMAGVIYDGQWLHVGTVQDIATAEKYLQKIPR